MRRIAIVLLAAAVLCAEAESEPLALVLSGGGAKGAYEVGVWQVLSEEGIAPRVAAISGTSVGAINAALFATRPDAAEALWLENMGDVFTLSTNRIGKSIQKTVDTVSNSVEVGKETGEAWKGIGHFVLSTALRVADDAVGATMTAAEREGFIDSSRLAEVLAKSLPAEWPASVPKVYATAMEKNTWKAKTWRINEEPQDRRLLVLRASAAIPEGFDTVRIDEKTYVDGGWESKGGDNVPLEPILKNHREIKTIIVVYLGDRMDRLQRNRNSAWISDVRLVEIIPSEDIDGIFGWGGVFDASPETAKHLIELGRKDARKALKNAGLTK